MFNGTNNGFELERPATRVEAITMLVRLLGKESEALNGTWNHPFTDVPSWADKIVGYAYEQDLTSGISSAKFGSSETVSATQYTTFVLRALGYSDSKETADFTWDNPFFLASKIGLFNNYQYGKDSEFLRADVAIVSYDALFLNVKSGNSLLKDTLPSASETPTEKPVEKPTTTPVPTEKPVEQPTTTPTPTEKPVDEVVDRRDAGVFGTPASKLVTVNKDVDYEVNLSKLNGMLFYTYGLTYTPDMTQNGTTGLGIVLKYDSANNRYGLKVGGWRKSYDSASNLNSMLNAILETFYFECGDKKVAKALWNWFDAKNINGYANTDDFGFKDTATFENGFTATMNGVSVDITKVNGATTVYFH